MKRLIHQPNGKIKCGYCGKEYSKFGIKTHIWRNHEDGKDFNPNKNRAKDLKSGKIKIWNKGLSKETDDRVKKSAQTFSDNLKTGKTIHGWLGKKHSIETREKISKALSKNNKGGKCKWYEVIKNNGDKVKVQGTWELKFSKVLNIIDDNWIKLGVGNKNHSFKWLDDEKNKHTYTPDFWSPKLQKYFEVKGYWWGNDKRKMELVLEQNTINVEILKKKELNNYLILIGEKV